MVCSVMGRRSGTKTAVEILCAFRERGTWEQHALARRLGVTTRSLRSTLEELRAVGVPLERDPENHSLVYWSVPRWWSRGLDQAELETCVRLVSRLPRSADRDRVLARLLRRDVEVGSASVFDMCLAAVEDACAAQRALRMVYRSTRDAKASERFVSVQRVEHGETPRFVAVCHRTGTLKTFRVDRVEHARPDDAAVFRHRPAEEVDALIARSLDGFAGDTETEAVFFVREPEARWLPGTLPAGKISVESFANGVRIRLRTTALKVLARRLVGLGDAVRIESPALRSAVVDLARRTLAANAPRLAKPAPPEGRRNSAGAAATKSLKP